MRVLLTEAWRVETDIRHSCRRAEVSLRRLGKGQTVPEQRTEVDIYNKAVFTMGKPVPRLLPSSSRVQMNTRRAVQTVRMNCRRMQQNHRLNRCRHDGVGHRDAGDWRAACSPCETQLATERCRAKRAPNSDTLPPRIVSEQMTRDRRSDSCS